MASIIFLALLLQLVTVFFFLLIFLLMVFCSTRGCDQRQQHKRYSSSSFTPRNWPFIGMLPSLLQNTNQIHGFITQNLKENGGTFMFKGPWFSNTDALITSEPANVHHILSKSFSNFPKGPDFKRIFDILGDGIFNSDGKLWESQRKTAMVLLHNHRFLKFVAESSWNKVEMGLIPVLDHFSRVRKVVDLQDLLERLTFDTTCISVLGKDPATLSIELPYNACKTAFVDAEEAILIRHVLPESVWKLQRWLGVGKEKKLSQAWEALDQLIAQSIASKEEEFRTNPAQLMGDGDNNEESPLDLLTAYVKAYNGKNDSFGNFHKYLRDSLLTLTFAGKDTTSAALTWFFWLVASNPSQEKKIREEIHMNLPSSFSNVEGLKKLVYLHGALCETLRLFPPVPQNFKASAEPDTLPSGDHVRANTRMVLSFYSMGRMESIWGEDCLEFKPERWITERGEIKHVPSFKFPPFNAGPRTCLGKDMSFVLMKIVAASVLCNYHIRVVDGHLVSPSHSIVLHMKYGLKVMVTKRVLMPSTD